MKNKKIVVVFIMISIMFSIFGKVYAEDEYFKHKVPVDSEGNAILFDTKEKLKEEAAKKGLVLDYDDETGYGCRIAEKKKDGKTYYYIICHGHKLGEAKTKYYHRNSANYDNKVAAEEEISARCNNYKVVESKTKGKVYAKCQGHSVQTQLSNGFNENLLPTGDESTINELKTPVDNIAGTIILILQVVTISAIIFTGIRYMFAGPDSKTEIKKTLPFLIAGIVIVFAGPTVIKFITDIFTQMTE